MSRCACLVIRNSQGEYLLQMRDNTPGIVWPLSWDTFGGGIEAGETPGQGAVREIQEELGIRATEADFELLVVIPMKSDEHFLLMKRTVEWGDFRVFEGAGAGFFTPEEILLIPASAPVRAFFEWRKAQA
jgi:8-oxo-dGTP pyrophosphatase MutT (NUDIX family)